MASNNTKERAYPTNKEELEKVLEELAPYCRTFNPELASEKSGFSLPIVMHLFSRIKA